MEAYTQPFLYLIKYHVGLYTDQTEATILATDR
jgi:hypothetical protein